jgi:hypothetical protein
MRAEMAVSGEMPLDYMIRIMRDPSTEPHRRRPRICIRNSPLYTTGERGWLACAGDPPDD